MKRQIEERKRKESKIRQVSVGVDELRQEFLELLQGKLTGQKRGYAFEKVLLNLAKTSCLEITEPFRVAGEQIDGAIKYDGEHYIIEAKWQDREATNECVYQFVHKVDGKMYGRGVIFSIQGFSENVIKSLVQGKSIKTIFVDGADLILVFEKLFSFSEMLDKKIKAAQTKGLIYIDINNGQSKIDMSSN